MAESYSRSVAELKQKKDLRQLLALEKAGQQVVLDLRDVTLSTRKTISRDGRREVRMLKITMTKTPTEERWILHGRLVGPWVRELQAVWRNTHRTDGQQRCVFDLNGVTFIDKGGEKLLRALAKEGAQFEARGIYVRDVVKQLRGGRRSRRPELLVCLLVTLLSGAVATQLSGMSCTQLPNYWPRRRYIRAMR